MAREAETYHLINVYVISAIVYSFDWWNLIYSVQMFMVCAYTRFHNPGSNGYIRYHHQTEN